MLFFWESKHSLYFELSELRLLWEKFGFLGIAWKNLVGLL